jgi:beta-alanine--pyruvate transaminase
VVHGLGHGRREIAEAVGKVAKLDYAPAFQFGHPARSRWPTDQGTDARRAGLRVLHRLGLGSADTSLKMARAYWRAKGQASKTRLIGREKGYHGVNFGGISVGGIGGNRKTFGQGVEADHLPHTQPPAGTFHKGMPATGPRWPTACST